MKTLQKTQTSTTTTAVLTVLAVLLAATALAVPAAAANTYVPFVTDFPRSPQSERYVPFVTDFPNYGAEAPPTGVAAHATGGSDRLYAAVGAAGGLALGALVAVSLLALRRRASLSTA